MREKKKHKAFLSYQTADKHIAGRIKETLESVGIDCFLAHEDIDVSDAWRERILRELEGRDIFICLINLSCDLEEEVERTS